MDAQIDLPYDLTPHITRQIVELNVDVKANVDLKFWLISTMQNSRFLHLRLMLSLFRFNRHNLY